jgi:hypothetical protein
MIDVLLFQSAAQRLASTAEALHPVLIALFAAPIFMAAVSRSTLWALLCGIITLAAAFTLSLGTPESTVYAIALWLAGWVVAGLGLQNRARRRVERAERELIHELRHEVNCIAARSDRWVLDQIQAAPSRSIPPVADTNVLPLKPEIFPRASDSITGSARRPLAPGDANE